MLGVRLRSMVSITPPDILRRIHTVKVHDVSFHDTVRTLFRYDGSSDRLQTGSKMSVYPTIVSNKNCQSVEMGEIFRGSLSDPSHDNAVMYDRFCKYNKKHDKNVELYASIYNMKQLNMSISYGITRYTLCVHPRLMDHVVPFTVLPMYDKQGEDIDECVSLLTKLNCSYSGDQKYRLKLNIPYWNSSDGLRDAIKRGYAQYISDHIDAVGRNGIVNIVDYFGTMTIADFSMLIFHLSRYVDNSMFGNVCLQLRLTGDNQSEVEQIVNYAVAVGIRQFDTSVMYHDNYAHTQTPYKVRQLLTYSLISDMLQKST